MTPNDLIEFSRFLGKSIDIPENPENSIKWFGVNYLWPDFEIISRPSKKLKIDFPGRELLIFMVQSVGVLGKEAVA